MRLTILVMIVALLVGGLGGDAFAQGTKSARGTVSAMGADTVTVKAGDRELKFMIDAKTVLTAAGAGTADRRAETTGKPGPQLSDFVKVGDAVEVSYLEKGGTLYAANIRRTRSPGAGGGGTSEDRAETATGTVASLNGTTLTISGSSGAGTFKQSFTVDGATKVVAVGAGTAATAAGGKVAITDHVGVGDQVTVTYRKAGTGLHADEVRVRAKKK